MAEIHGRAGPLLACHVIQRQGPQPHPGMLNTRTRPAPAAWGPLTADARPIADPFPTGPADIPLPRPQDRLRSFTLTSIGSDDGIRRHPQDLGRPL
jgi:hypothetical protein